MSNITRKIIKNNSQSPPLIYPRSMLQYMPGDPLINNAKLRNRRRHTVRLLGQNTPTNSSSSNANVALRATVPLARLRTALLAGQDSPARQPFNLAALLGRPLGPAAVLLPENGRPPVEPDPDGLVRLLALIPRAPITPPPPPPPPPALVRSPSMVFGGTTSLDEILPRIQAYIDRFFRPSSLTANELISYYIYSNAGHTKVIPHDTFMDLISEIPRSELLKLQNVISSGSYGRVYKSSDPTKVVKTVTYEFDPYGGGDLLVDYFAETLIQFIIQTDETYGSAVPAIHNIYKQESSATLYIVMDKLDESLDSRLIADGAAHGKARFSLFKNLMIQLLRILIHLNTTYGFVHRDLKGNNIMLQGDTIKLIDFGLSVMNFTNAEGTTFRLAASTMFPIKSLCRFRQDVGQLFVYLNEHRDRLDQKTINFLIEILPVGLRSKGYRQMYNTTGTIMGCPTTAVLDPSRALERLEAFNGGRRRTRGRKRRN
jgi:hypothetical protein